MRKKLSILFLSIIIILLGVPFYLGIWTSDDPVSDHWFCTGLIMVLQTSFCGVGIKLINNDE
jgi:hypothetical protein